MMVTRAFISIATAILVAGPSLAQPYVTVVNLADFVSLRSQQKGRPLSPSEVPSRQLDQASLREFHNIFRQLADPTLPIIRPCGVPEGLLHQCKVPRTNPPLFPLEHARRNWMLQRPTPEIVRANIEEATHGELSTVDELVGRVIPNIRNMSVLGDDELTLLASNFHSSKPGWIVDTQCTPLDYEDWPEDLLVSDDEQRALTAAFWYAFRDPGYMARREDALREQILVSGQQRNPRSVLGRAQKLTNMQLDLFQQRVARLEREVIITEEEWQVRYDEHVDALRAGLYRIAAMDSSRSWESIEPLLENLVTSAEAVADNIMCHSTPRDRDAGFSLFLSENRKKLEQEFPGIGIGKLERLLDRRWKIMSAEAQASHRARANVDAFLPSA